MCKYLVVNVVFSKYILEFHFGRRELGCKLLLGTETAMSYYPISGRSSNSWLQGDSEVLLV